VSDIRLGDLAGVVAGKAIGTVATLAVTALVARLLGPDGLGRWSLLAAAGALLHSVFINWTHGPTVRYGHEEWVVHGRLTRTFAARLPLAALGVASAMVLLVAQPGDWLRRVFAADPADWKLVGLFLVATWMTAEGQAVLQATHRLRWLAVVAPVVAASSVVALALLGSFGLPSLPSAITVVTAASIIGWGSAWVHVVARSLRGFGSVEGAEVRRHLRYGLPIIPNFMLGYASSWGAHLLLNQLSSVTQVGIFTLAYQFTLAIMAANSLVTLVLLPRAIGKAVQDPGFLRRYIEMEVPALHALWMFATVWIIAVLPSLFAVMTATPFGDSPGALLILLAAIPSSIAASLYKIPFNVQERMRAVVAYSAVMTVISIAVSGGLIPRFGAAGAAVGTALSFAVVQACYLSDQHRRLGVASGQAWKLWAAGLTLGATQVFFGPALAPRLFWAVAATLLLIVLVRAIRCVDQVLLERAFEGRLRPVATVMNRVLVAKT
jgi:O-antigen/teichoic acid export membrane protein